jgi:hypothetical protein
MFFFLLQTKIEREFFLQIAEMLPGILNHLGSDGLTHLKRLASAAANSNRLATLGEEDGDIPDLVENFEQAMGTAEVNVDEAVERSGPSEIVD